MSNHNNHMLQAGTTINDKWVILEFLGKGGMGEVYRAHQLNLKRDIAIKIISREWLASVQDNEEEREIGLQRFHNEVLSMAQVRHPNLLQIYDYGSLPVKKGETTLEYEYIAMEYIPGGTLRSTMSEEGFYTEKDLLIDWLMKYFLPVLDGVQALHSAGIIHRDIKPGNILMDGENPRITDFGLARSSRIRPVTISTDIKGTPPYMSPEHFMDLKRADHRSDIYSLGKMLFEAIDGKMGTDLIPLKSANLHEAESPFFKKLDQIIQTATAEDKNDRYGSIEELRSVIIEAVEIIETGRKTGKSENHGILQLLSRPKWIWGGFAIAVSLVMAMTLWHLFGQTVKSNQIPNGSSSSLSESKLTKPLESIDTIDKPALSQSVLTGKDGAKLHLIPEGQVLLPSDKIKEPEKSIMINSFYMDETEVTNHQYAEFLNSVLSNFNVEERAVKADGIVLLLLGEVAKGYEPIIFKGGKFVVKDPLYHSHPVVRVTAYGAAAYAKYYGRRLPTAAEWFYVMKSGNYSEPGTPAAMPQQPTMAHTGMMHGQGQPPSSEVQRLPEKLVSVAQSKPNSYGIRGLNGNVNEWGILGPKESSKKSKGLQYGVLPEAVGRSPWEAFKNVGFRTVLPVSK